MHVQFSGTDNWFLVIIKEYFKFAYFFLKSYVLNAHYNGLAKVIIMSSENNCFYGKLSKIRCILQLLSNTHLISSTVAYMLK